VRHSLWFGLLAIGFSGSVFASTLSCTSAQSANGSSYQVLVGPNDEGVPVVVYSTRGPDGRSTMQGPFRAKLDEFNGKRVYTFELNENESGSVTIETVRSGSSLKTMASTNFSLWQGLLMKCELVVGYSPLSHLN
jgi:hypothetical protein